MQNDFISGPFGTPEAKAIVSRVVDKIKSWDGDIAATADIHFKDTYSTTKEGHYFPPHCIAGTIGQKICKELDNLIAINEIPVFLKENFSSTALANFAKEGNYDYVELIGVCTDICVISNAFSIQEKNKKAKIVIDASCCAGTSPELHQAALKVMKSCCIDIIGE
jgi:nicotinamidase-related amidase